MLRHSSAVEMLTLNGKIVWPTHTATSVEETRPGARAAQIDHRKDESGCESPMIAPMMRV